MTYKIFLLKEKRKQINSFVGTIETTYKLEEPDIFTNSFDSDQKCKEIINANPDIFKYKDIVILPIYRIED